MSRKWKWRPNKYAKQQERTFPLFVSNLLRSIRSISSNDTVQSRFMQTTHTSLKSSLITDFKFIWHDEWQTYAINEINKRPSLPDDGRLKLPATNITDERSPPLSKLEYCDGIWPFARQRLGKHYLKAGLIAEAEVIVARQINTCFRGNKYEQRRFRDNEWFIWISMDTSQPIRVQGAGQTLQSIRQTDVVQGSQKDIR
jgi:hypothetical protein